MRFCPFLRDGAVATLLFVCPAPPAAAQAVVADLPTPSGTERAAFFAALQAHATVILLAGGEGIVQIDGSGNSSNTNFLIRTRAMWQSYAINAVILGSSDGRSLLGQRSQPGYAAALGAAVDFARSRANVPVWLVGTSQGSTGAVTGAVRLGGKVAGIVLSSSVTQQSRSGETAFTAGVNAVAVPALVVGNSRDTCRASPPGDAQNLLAAMTGSPRKEVVLFESTAIQSDPCEPMSPHGYLGIEASVIQRMAVWINAAPGR